MLHLSPSASALRCCCRCLRHIARRTVFFFATLLRSSQNLHNSMLARIVRAPITFFDATPVGRVINRFSNDVGEKDPID